MTTNNQNRRISILIDAELSAQFRRIFSRADDAVDDLGRSYTEMGRDANRAEQEVEQTTQEVRRAGRTADDASEDFKRFGGAMATIPGPAGQVGRSVEEITRQFSNVGQSASKLSGPFKVVTGLLIGGAVVGGVAAGGLAAAFGFLNGQLDRYIEL